MLLLSIYLIYFQLYLKYVETKFYKTNITDFSKCQIYYSRYGTIYKDFFEIPPSQDNGTLLDFHFSVMTSSDAHILLAPSAVLDKDDPVYEIVIGAGGNTFCDIRRKKKSLVKATVRIKGLLTALDIQSFWIHMSKDGVIDVGKQGEELAFISWTDVDPLPLKVFSFSTWPGIEAKWYFNCPWEDGSKISPVIEKPLTPLEKLRKDYLYYYNPYNRPALNNSQMTTIGLTLAINSVNLNEHESIFELSGVIILDWTDEKLKWEPSGYGGLNKMHIFRREIWVPHVFLFNSANFDEDILDDSMIIVNSTGSVIWKTSINSKSWCSPNGLGRWPQDQHICKLTLGFLRDVKNLRLIFRSKESIFDTPYLSNWMVTLVESFWNKGWNNSNTSAPIILDPPGLNIYFHLSRVSNSYTIILFTPFLVIAVSLLITFWISPFTSYKIGLICFQIILSVCVLLTLGLILPTHSKVVPNLLLLYSYNLVASVICIIIQIIIINLARNPPIQSLPSGLTKCLLNSPVQCLLFLPKMKFSDLGELKLKNYQKTLWILLSVTIDRLCFIVYLLLAIFAFYITYC